MESNIEWEQCGNLIRTKRNEDGSGGWLVAEVSLGLPDHARTARLLTAAPELLEALQDAEMRMRSYLDLLRCDDEFKASETAMIRAAIAGATGESA